MELIRGLHNLRPRHRGCVATIGAFDGVHLGHQAVIEHLLEKSSELALPSVIIVFEPLPREYFSPVQAPARIMSFWEKCRALEALGVDRVLRIRFNEQFRSMSAQQFVDDVFVAGLALATQGAGNRPGMRRGCCSLSGHPPAAGYPPEASQGPGSALSSAVLAPGKVRMRAEMRRHIHFSRGPAAIG